MRRSIVIAGAAFLAAAGTVVAGTASGATSRCGTTVTVAGPPGISNKLTVSPSVAKLRVGDCVAFHNDTNPSRSAGITITRGGKRVYSTTVAGGQTVAGAQGFAPSQVGEYALTATVTEPLGIVAHGQSSITAKAAPTTKPSASSTPTPKSSSSPHHTPKPTKSASSPKHHKKKSSPKPHATGIKLPPLPPLPTGVLTAPVPKGTDPVVAPGPTTAPPVTESATPVAAIFHGPIEPAADNSRGLPIAIAVLVFLGGVSGWGRALLATATGVDKRRNGDHRI